MTARGICDMTVIQEDGVTEIKCDHETTFFEKRLGKFICHSCAQMIGRQIRAKNKERKIEARKNSPFGLLDKSK